MLIVTSKHKTTTSRSQCYICMRSASASHVRHSDNSRFRLLNIILMVTRGGRRLVVERKEGFLYSRSGGGGDSGSRDGGKGRGGDGGGEDRDNASESAAEAEAETETETAEAMPAR